MLTECQDHGSRTRTYMGLSTDVKSKQEGGNCYKVLAENGDKIYTMDTQEVYMYDEENAAWRSQEDGSVV